LPALLVDVVTQNGNLLFAVPFFGYGFAWFGHFVFEKNRPATFVYPLYSLGSDFVMFWHILTGQINQKNGGSPSNRWHSQQMEITL
jgi:hypothetical protein